jgi:hypothetical protein
MAILLKCGAIFFHIPKTGGNWVSEVLEQNNLVFAHIGGKHMGMKQMGPLEELFKTPRRYSKPNKFPFKFCFVRHPLKWYESWFQMMVNLGWPRWGDEPAVWNPSVLLDGLGDKSFDSFVRNVLNKQPGFVSEMYRWYTDQGIEFVGRQETLADDLITVLNLLDVEFEEERIRAVKPVNVSDTLKLSWNPDLKQSVEQAEYSAFQRFGYQTKMYPVTKGLPAHTSDSQFGPESLAAIPLLAPFEKQNGYAWHIRLSQFAHFSDDLNYPYRSSLLLVENGQTLSQRHALYDDICLKGCGRYSHWQDYLIFSTSDNTNPNTNGRTYEIKFRFCTALDRDCFSIKG